MTKSILLAIRFIVQVRELERLPKGDCAVEYYYNTQWYSVPNLAPRNIGFRDPRFNFVDVAEPFPNEAVETPSL